MLTGPSIVLNPAIHAYRDDLADVALAGQIFAPHYARPVSRLCVRETPVRSGPSEDAPGVFELARGEEFALLDMAGGWAWGYRRSDHRVGYLRSEALE